MAPVTRYRLFFSKVVFKKIFSCVLLYEFHSSSSSSSFLVRHHDDDEVDDVSCLHAVLSLQLATASLNCIFRSSKSSLMFSIHFLLVFLGCVLQ